MNLRGLFLFTAAFVAATAFAADRKPAAPPPVIKTLFDFENATDVNAWSNLELPEAKTKEPAAKIEISPDNATSGNHSLNITFAGGSWPTITTTQIPDDWNAFETFHADVTVTRPCLVGFTALQEKSSRAQGWEGGISRWVKTELLKTGKNHVSAPLKHSNGYSINAKYGKVVRFEIFMYNPHQGESIWVDNIQLSSTKEPAVVVKKEFKVLGTDLVVADVQDLGKKLKDKWTKPIVKSIDEVEAEFRNRFEEVKRTHPRAVLAVLRDGEKGLDAAHPEKVYEGWKDAYWSSHGPDGLTLERADNRGRSESHEIFMRHRSPLMRVDFASIPQGSDILAAQLVIVRAGQGLKDHDQMANPTMWVAEPCNRPWDEYEVNTYQYAKDKFWKENGGMRWTGDDPDFLTTFVAHGPGGAKVNVWDFTEAIKFWTDGKRPNHGFMLHGDGRDYMTAYAREAKEIKNRPAVLVIYEPK